MFSLNDFGTIPTPTRSRRVEFDKTSSYHVGKSVATVNSVFRTDGSAITDILSRLIQSDTEQCG
jgi:hypothetical protein